MVMPPAFIVRWPELRATCSGGVGAGSMTVSSDVCVAGGADEGHTYVLVASAPDASALLAPSRVIHASCSRAMRSWCAQTVSSPREPPGAVPLRRWSAGAPRCAAPCEREGR